jgi:hypothetical protein
VNGTWQGAPVLAAAAPGRYLVAMVHRAASVMNRTMCFVVVAVALAGCAKAPPTAASVCAKLEAEGVATGCKPGTPAAMGARAAELVTFDLAGVPARTGQVMSFADAEAYTATVQGFDAAAAFAGPHRYGNDQARILVALHSAAPPTLGAKAQSVVDGL